MNKKVVSLAVAFAVGMLAMLIIDVALQLTVRSEGWHSEESVQATIAAELVRQDMFGREPTAVPPAPSTPCPTVTYKALPDVRLAKENLQGGIAEIQFGRDNLQKMLDATEGEYNWNVVAAVAVIDSGLSMLDETYAEVEFWQRLEKMTCPAVIPQYDSDGDRMVCESWRFSEKRFLIEDNHDMAIVILDGLYGMNASLGCMEYDRTFGVDLDYYLRSTIKSTEMLASWLCEDCDG